MTKEELQEIGRKVYGPAWKAKLARDLARSPATVFNWVAGRIAIPKTAERRIRDLATRHASKEAR